MTENIFLAKCLLMAAGYHVESITSVEFAPVLAGVGLVVSGSSVVYVGGEVLGHI